MGDLARPSLRQDLYWSLPLRLRVSTSLRDQEEGVQIKRISIPESNSGEIQESGIDPEKTSSNSISSFGSRSEQISASRKPLFLDTTLCLKVRKRNQDPGKKLRLNLGEF